MADNEYSGGTTYRGGTDRVYYQSTVATNLKAPKTNELLQIAESMRGFNRSFDKYVDKNLKDIRTEAQTAFDVLKNDGITDPDEIKKLMDANDPRTAPLKEKYAENVLNVNFGMSHALQDIETLNQTAPNDMETADLDAWYGTVERSFDGKGESYKRGYVSVMGEAKSSWQGVQLKAQEEGKIKALENTVYTKFQQAWSADPSATIPDIIANVEAVWRDEVGKMKDYSAMSGKANPINPNAANAILLNMLEQAIVTSDGNPKTLKAVEAYLNHKRGAKGELPSFLNTSTTADKSASILKQIRTIAKKSVVDLAPATALLNGNARSANLSKKDLRSGVEIIKNDFVAKELAKLNDTENPALKGVTLSEEQKNVMAYIAAENKLMDLARRNGVVIPQMEDTLLAGIAAPNNDEIYDEAGMDRVTLGYKLWQKMNQKGIVNNPAADYLSDSQEAYYKSIDLLMTTGENDLSTAAIKAWKAQQLGNNYWKEVISLTDFNKELDGFELDGGNLNGIARVNARGLLQMYLNSGVALDQAVDATQQHLESTYVIINDQVWNKRKFPMASTDLANLETKSAMLAISVAKQFPQYDADDLTLVPYLDGTFVMVDSLGKPILDLVETLNPKGETVKTRMTYTHEEVFGTGKGTIAGRMADQGVENLVAKSYNEKIRMLEEIAFSKVPTVVSTDDNQAVSLVTSMAELNEAFPEKIGDNDMTVERLQYTHALPNGAKAIEVKPINGEDGTPTGQYMVVYILKGMKDSEGKFSKMYVRMNRQPVEHMDDSLEINKDNAREIITP